MTRDWEEIGRTVQGLAVRFRELGGEPQSFWHELPAEKLAVEMRMAEALDRLPCDAHLRAVLRPGGVMGQPTSRQAYFCTMRCLCALDTLGIIHAELDNHALYPKPPVDWTDQQLLECHSTSVAGPSGPHSARPAASSLYQSARP